MILDRIYQAMIEFLWKLEEIREHYPDYNNSKYVPMILDSLWAFPIHSVLYLIEMMIY